MASRQKAGVLGFPNNPIPPGKRSNDKAILVLLGLTGAGKTTTLNFLFDKEKMIETESYCSATSRIMEYNAKIQCDDDDDCYDLLILDTPGFGDTRQQPQLRDARFVATFDHLLRTHLDLRSCYPTTVLLVAKFNDDRIDGETSHFIQMLKAVDALLANYRLLEKTAEYANLVFVLTHTMSEDNISLRIDPTPKIKLIESLVKTFTKIPTPIQVVMAENKPHLYNLPMANEYYKLPNGQCYPFNLYNKIQAMAVKAQDPVGERIVREAFKNPSKISLELKKEYELFPENNPIVKDVLKILKGARFAIENNWISGEIKRQWDLLDEVFKRPYVNSLQITQSTFHRHKIFGERDLPTQADVVLKLLMDLPLNLPILAMLEGLGIVGPELPKSLSAGHFYNIFSDCPMTSSPFAMDAVEYTEIGFRAARGIQARVASETNLVLTSAFDNASLYYQDRLTQLNIHDEFKIENFYSVPKEGYNIVPPRTKVGRLTGVREKRVFTVFLKQPTLSAGFRSAISNLPAKFQPDQADRWRSFFMGNGTHVVQSVFAGGAIEVIATKKEKFDPNKKETSAETVLSIIADILGNVGVFMPIALDAKAEDWDFKINFRGGDPGLVHPTLKHVFTPQGVTFFKKWSESLYSHPAMLQSEIGLECVTTYFRKTNASAAKEIKAAMTHLFCPPPTEKEQGVSGVSEIKLDAQPTPNNWKRTLVQTAPGHSRSHSSTSVSSSSSGSNIENVPRGNVQEPQQKPRPDQGRNQQKGWREWFREKFIKT